MYKVIIWGTGREYNKHYNLIKYFETIGEISVQAVFSNDKIGSTTLDGYTICSKEQIGAIDYDLCLVAIADFGSAKSEARELGIPKDKLIPIRILEIPYFNFEKYMCVRKSKISILSNNCWAGLCYHYFAMEFQSPTINMFFERGHFNKFIANLDYYLSVPVEFVEMRYETNLKRDYPVAKIDDIILHFNHYTSFEEARESWERRKKRVNKENILVIFSSTSIKDMLEFINLEFEHKLMFIPDEIEPASVSNYPVSYNDKGDGVTFGMFINSFANGGNSKLDLLSLLNHDCYIRK